MDSKCGTCSRTIAPHNKREKTCGGCKEGVNYISYPENIDYFDGPSGASRVIFKRKPEVVPSQPPWTTWSGTLMADKDSFYGEWLQKHDPNAEDGFVFVDKKKVAVPGKIRGLYTREI
jgi:hypothetical protein